jgi:hypothetical protein
MFSFFYVIQTILFIFGMVMSVKKNNYLKNYTLFYVILIGYGKGVAHWICSHVWLWEKTITL